MFKKVDGKIIFDGEVKELPKVEIVEGKRLEDTSFIVSKDDVIDALKLVFDPEINIDVYNLGLIYNIDISPIGDVNIEMTLTSPTCPMAEEIPHWVAESVASLDGVGEVKVNLVWAPAWSLDKLSDEAKFQLDIMDMELE